MNALDYLLKANLYGLLFVSCYWLFLRRHTFFSLNRFYLLTSAILSLVLPLASLPTQTVEIVPASWPVPVGVINLPAATIAPAPVLADTAPDWETIALIAYGLIAALLVLRLAIRVGRLFWLIRRSRQQVFADYVLVEAPKTAHSSSESPTFSFFRYLVINPADINNELIIRHELVHIRQVHSADVLGLALLRSLFWACPALWFFDRMLRQVHEFLADREASQPTEYARFLLEYAFSAQPDALTNGFFNPSLLRQRIQMLYQTATPRWALGKYTLILPLVLGLLAMTTARQEITALSLTNPNELPAMGATAPYRVIKPNLTMPIRIPPSVDTINGEVYRAVEEAAVFPTGIPGLMHYVAHTLKYPAKAKAAGVEGKVLVRFVVLPTGAIGSATVEKGIGNGCDEEALRVVKHMPRWLPAKQDGQAVATQHIIPIQFSLDKKEDKRTGQVL